MTQPTDPAVEQPQQDPAATEVPEGTQSESEPTPNSEAARYRVERNEARTERDTLAERLTGYQRRECEAVIADLLDVPADLWEIGQADLTAFYNDDGTVNETEIRAAAAALLQTRPRLGKPAQPTPHWGQHGGTPTSGGGVTWGQVIKPN